jgi:hypothetical protein
VLPSHQENFGIAVVEALACGKPVLISDQVNIWREIVEDGAGMVEGDTEEGVEKLLRRFFERLRAEGGEVGGSVFRSFGVSVEGQGAESGPVEHASHSTGRGPRACYLKRFAIGPAAAKLAEALSAES